MALVDSPLKDAEAYSWVCDDDSFVTATEITARPIVDAGAAFVGPGVALNFGFRCHPDCDEQRVEVVLSDDDVVGMFLMVPLPHDTEPLIDTEASYWGEAATTPQTPCQLGTCDCPGALPYN